MTSCVLTFLFQDYKVSQELFMEEKQVVKERVYSTYRHGYSSISLSWFNI